jgi:hypothetical protein
MPRFLEVAMSDVISHLIAAANAIPAHADNPVVAMILEVIFFSIVIFTLLLSIGAICGGIFLAIQQAREDVQAWWQRRRAGARPV